MHGLGWEKPPFLHPNPHFPSGCRAPSLTKEDSQHGCVPAGGQPRGSSCYGIAQLARVGHMGLLQGLVDTICIVGWQETQQPGSCSTKKHGMGPQP